MAHHRANLLFGELLRLHLTELLPLQRGPLLEGIHAGYHRFHTLDKLFKRLPRPVSSLVHAPPLGQLAAVRVPLRALYVLTLPRDRPSLARGSILPHGSRYTAL